MREKKKLMTNINGRGGIDMVAKSNNCPFCYNNKIVHNINAIK